MTIAMARLMVCYFAMELRFFVTEIGLLMPYVSPCGFVRDLGAGKRAVCYFKEKTPTGTSKFVLVRRFDLYPKVFLKGFEWLSQIRQVAVSVFSVKFSPSVTPFKVDFYFIFYVCVVWQGTSWVWKTLRRISMNELELKLSGGNSSRVRWSTTTVGEKASRWRVGFVKTKSEEGPYRTCCSSCQSGCGNARLVRSRLQVLDDVAGWDLPG